MKSKTKKIILAVAAIGAIAAGGAAFTAANVVPDNVAGYGSSTVNGADATKIEHTLGPDGTTVVSTEITFTTLTADSVVQADFGVGASTNCPVVGQVATCTYATPVDTASAATFNVAVVN
jgi:hypothetical protein